MAPKSSRPVMPPARRWTAKSVRPRCLQLEDRTAPALFNVQAPMSFAGLNNNGCVAVADLDKDGRMDAILTDFGTDYATGAGTKIHVLYGQASGGFNQVQASTGGKNVSFVTIADINGDGWPDAVVVNANQQNAGSVSVFQNDGAGHLGLFGTHSTASNNPSWVGLADVTGDGVLDLVVGSFGKDDGTGENVVGNNVTIFAGNADALGHGDFTFAGSPVTTLAPEIQFIPTALAVADFNGDGILDIAAAVPGVPADTGQPQPNGSVYVFQGVGGGAFDAPNQYDSGGALPVNIQAADVNGDGKPDLVVANAGDPNATPEFLNTSVGVIPNVSSAGSVNFGVTNTLTSNCHGTFAVAVADFNMDGKADIAAVNYGSELGSSPAAFVSAYKGDGAGSFIPFAPGTFDTLTNSGGGQYLAVGDFNNDGSPDLIVAHASNLVGLMTNTTVPAPTINQAAGQADPTNGSSIKFDVTFPSGVTGFDATDIDLSASTNGGVGLTAAVAPVDASHYTVTVTGMAPNSTGIVKATFGPGAANTIVGGNPTPAPTSTDNQVSYDYVAPTVTINQAATQADPTTSSPIKFTVVFSEAVTGFTAVTLGGTVGGTLQGSVTGSGTTYTVSVTGMSGSGTVVATIPPGAAADPAGNPSAASTSTDNTVTFGSATAPTVTINQATAQLDPTNASPIAFDVHFSESVTGFDGSDVRFNGSTVGGTPVAAVSGSGADYTVTVTGMTGAGTVVATIPAGAATNSGGTGSAASTSTDNTVTFDSVPPAVTVNQAVGQADPTNVSSIKFDVKFSEPVTGFGDPTDVSFAGSTAGGTLLASVAGSGDTYTVTVTGMTTRGSVVVSVPAGGAADAAGNLNLASTSTDNSVEFINTGVLTFSQAVYDVKEDSLNPQDRVATITVTRSGQTDGAVSIDFATSDGTAHTTGDTSNGQADYMHNSGTLHWADGEGGAKTFFVQITQDNYNEGRELINLTLSNPTGGAGLGLTSAVAAIAPSDGKVIDGTVKLPQAVFPDATGLAGDLVTVRLGGRVGTATVYRTDPDGDGNGPIELIELANTDPTRSNLVISVKKPKGGFGNGRGELAEVTGSGLKSLIAPTTDLNGSGIHLSGFLGTLRIGDVGGAAAIKMGAPPAAIKHPAARITAGVIGDGTDIEIAGAPLANLTATSVGDGSITAPSIGTILARGKARTRLAAAIPGDFKSDVTVSGVGVDPTKLALTRLRAAGTVTGATIDVGGSVGAISVGARGVGDFTGAVHVTGNLNVVRVAGKVVQTNIDVAGNVKSVAVGSFWNSRLDAGYTGPDDGSGTFDTPSTIGTFVVTSKLNGFQSSYVIASFIKAVTLSSVNPDNSVSPGTKFGVTVNQSLMSLVVTSPTQSFRYDPAKGSPQTTAALGEFEVLDKTTP